MPVPVWCEGVFNGVRKLGNTRLLKPARGTLERVREAQEMAYEILPTFSSFQIEHGLVESLQKFTSFDSEVFVLVFRHLSPIRRRLDQPRQLARQSSELPGGLQRLIRAYFRFLGGLRDIGDCLIDLRDRSGLLFRTELDFSRSLSRGSEQLRDLL